MTQAAPTTLTPAPFPGAIRRRQASQAYSFGTSQATASPIDIRQLAGIAVQPTSSTTTATTSLTWYGGLTPTGPWALIHDAGTSGVQTVTDSAWQNAPDQIFPFPYVIPVADVAGVGAVTGKT